MRVQLQELNESLKDVQEEMREPKSKNVGLGTLPVQVDCCLECTYLPLGDP